jgi:HlyD family secretion protein
LNDLGRQQVGEISQAPTPRDKLIGRVLRWMRRRPLRSLVIALILAFLCYNIIPDGATRYKTAVVTRGTITETIVASGRVVPRQTVKVGAQTSGLVTSVTVDVNQKVRAGQVLAVIEPDRLDSAVEQAEAARRGAEAGLRDASAGIVRSTADLTEAERQRQRFEALGKKGFASTQAIDGAIAVAARARAAYASAQAQVSSARSQLDRANAQLAEARTTLSRSVILSPITGIIIGRQVDPGQTLATGFQTPVLFEVASDLSQMIVETTINEADIGKVSVGQVARVTVDAYPDRPLRARVVQIRPQAVEGSGTVNYLVRAELQKNEVNLLPGMSTEVEIVTASANRALLIPATALTFEPPPEGHNSIPKIQRVRLRSRPAGESAVPPIRVEKTGDSSPKPRAPGNLRVWRVDHEDSGRLIAVPVRTGLRDDGRVEVRGGDIKIGDVIAVGLADEAP